MSRQIDLSKPLSDEDKQYLLDRWDVAALERNAALTGGEEFVVETPTDLPPLPTPNPSETKKAVEDMTVDELKTELSEAGAPVSGNKEELQLRLIEVREAAAQQ